MSARRYRIPSKLETVHAYHPEYNKLIEFNQKLAMESIVKTKTLKIKLFKKQKGRCAMCKEYLIDGDFVPFEGYLHIHHVVKRSKGGSKSNISNMQLIHRSCHILHHKEEKEQRHK
jgi:5-methylcytosine-specific restriction endonuclease McrA